MKNTLPKEIFSKRARISVKGRFGFRSAVEVVPRFRRHLLTRNRPQIPKPHLFQWLFDHKFSIRGSDFPPVIVGIAD
jgi:hypothetical protein